MREYRYQAITTVNEFNGIPAEPIELVTSCHTRAHRLPLKCILDIILNVDVVIVFDPWRIIKWPSYEHIARARRVI